MLTCQDVFIALFNSPLSTLAVTLGSDARVIASIQDGHFFYTEFMQCVRKIRMRILWPLNNCSALIAEHVFLVIVL